MRHLQTKLLTALIAFLPTLSWALPSDRTQPIEIEADHAQIDDAEGITQYKGEAVLTQGTLRIKGDIITFYYDENKQLKKAVAQGNLATYKQVQKLGEEPVRARALQMEYYATSQKIYLLGKGHVWQAGDEFSGNKIEYDINKNLVNANSAPVKVKGKVQKAERVHIIIQPPGSKKKATAPKRIPKTPLAPAPVKNEGMDQQPTAFTITGLNVRSGPSIQYNKLGTFIANTEVMILTEQKEWLQVRGEIDNRVVIGWVNRRYIQVKP